MDAKPISILLVDDHPLIRKGIQILLDQECDLYLRKDVESRSQCLRYLERCQTLPQVAVVDLSLKDGNGIELIKVISKNYPSVACLAISMHEESDFAEQCLNSGGKGYIMKSEPPDKLIEAIKLVASGGVWLSDSARQQVLNSCFGEKSMNSALSTRELEVLKLIGEGYKPKSIANSLGIAVKTVNAHKENLKSKLGLKSTAQLTSYALSNLF